jgi:hypothetical protein
MIAGAALSVERTPRNWSDQPDALTSAHRRGEDAARVRVPAVA